MNNKYRSIGVQGVDLSAALSITLDTDDEYVYRQTNIMQYFRLYKYKYFQ